MKNLFEAPVLNVTRFDAGDVVMTTSGLTGAQVIEQQNIIQNLAEAKQVTLKDTLTFTF